MALNGEPLERVRQRNTEEMLAGAKPKRDIISHGEYQGMHRRRTGSTSPSSCSPPWELHATTSRCGRTGCCGDFRQFDAPVSLVLTYDRTRPRAVCHFDLGALCYGIVLAAWNCGLGSVINGQGITRSDIVREVAGIPEDQAIMTCVAMGYPDDSFPADAVTSDREQPNSDFVRYVGFGD